MLAVISPIMLAVVVTGVTIRDIDFRNFTFNWYPRWADTPPGGRKIKLTDGDVRTGFDYGKEPFEFFLIDNGVKYGDLTRDGREEAIVVLGVMYSGTARGGIVFVYTPAKSQPKRLFVLETGDRSDYGYHDARIERGNLVIERYKPHIIVYRGEKHNMSSSAFYIRDYYKWNGARFRKIKTQTIPVDANDRAPWAHRI